MRSNNASLIQGVLLTVILITTANTPAMRQFIFSNFQLLIVATCVAGIFYLQVHKAIRAKERRLKEKIKDQSELINNLLLANSINTRLLRDIAIPRLFENDTEDLVKRLRDSGLNLSELSGYGLNKRIIAQYEMFYYLSKIEEQQNQLNSLTKANIESINLTVVRDMTKEVVG
jgi:hypothetical protein